jgi:hypothetical protein
MSKKRPTRITVLAVLNLVFGGLALCCMTCGAAMLLPAFQDKLAQMGQKATLDHQAALEKYLDANVAGYQAFRILGLVISVGLGVWLVIGGVALLRMWSWARWFCAAWSIVLIFYLLCSMVYNIVMVLPANHDFEVQNKVPFQMPQEAFVLILVVGTLFWLIYPVVLLVFMLVPGTVRAFAIASSDDEARAGEDYYDPEFERRRRDVPPEDS